MLNKIEHIVVLMLENRSFDHMIGWLYDPQNKPPFNRVPRGQAYEGLSGKHFSNPIPRGVKGAERKEVPVGRTKDPLNLQVNPYEDYKHVNKQLYGTKRTPRIPGFKAPMNGFVTDYIEALRKENTAIDYNHYKRIMDCYTPDALPVLSTLAYEYAICDHWFSSVPSETWGNRSFLHAGTSSGFVDNMPYLNWFKSNNAETIFNKISDQNNPDLNWRIYYDKLDIFPLTLLIHFPKLMKYWSSHFSYMEQFKQDAKQGKLPAYSFIEPRYFMSPNDQHPPHNVLMGEQLIYEVYQALRNGANWEQTLFIITYDEHGGCYDHVSPPVGIPPHPNMKGQYGFGFNRLGVRVPTVLISPYIERGTVFRARELKGQYWVEVPLDHTSILKTITNRWGLGSLTDRDKAAMDVSQALTRSTPRRDSPVIRPLNAEETADSNQQPLTALQQTVIRAFAAFNSVKPPKPQNVPEALSFLEKLLRESGI